MTKFNPTPEQAAIVAAATSSKDNLLVNALAGAAKTSTLVLLAEALAPQSILCLAFNKKIADEMRERLPSNCESMTLNSLGHRAWGQSLGKRLTLEKSKNYNILKGIIDGIKDPRVKDEVFESFSDLTRNLGFAKSCGWIPDGTFPHGKRLMSDAEFFGHLDDAPSPLEEDILRKAMKISIEQAWNGVIDFDDQIFMPTLFTASFPIFPIVMVDESQDLSALNHATLKKLVKGRLIAVGDPCQAIYGFRGAHEDSMALLKERFQMREMTLSVSFRCPQAVVREAQWRAPHMTWPDWAIEGEVTSLPKWGVETLPEEAAIICRNNAPIFSMAIRLFANGRYAQIVGNDIGKFLIKTLKKFGKPDLPQADVYEAINRYEAAKLAKARNAARVKDETTCLRIFADKGQNLGAIIAYAETIINMHGPVKLMTGHKSKGLEFNDVFILDRHLLRLEAEGRGAQDKNLLYVMQTRAKKRLTYIESDTFVGENYEEEE